METLKLLPTPRAGNPGSRPNKKGGKILELISSRVDSPVSHSRKLVFGKVKVMNDTYGQKCLELYPNLNQNGLSLKMLEGYLLYKTEWCLSKSALIWKKKITKSRRLLFQLAPSAPRIEETGFGLLPTARVGGNGTVSKKEIEQGNPKRRLETQIAMLKTLSASEGIGRKTGLKLQPNFVEWMMGFPLNWTNLNYQNQNIGLKD